MKKSQIAAIAAVIRVRPEESIIKSVKNADLRKFLRALRPSTIKQDIVLAGVCGGACHARHEVAR